MNDLLAHDLADDDPAWVRFMHWLCGFAVVKVLGWWILEAIGSL